MKKVIIAIIILTNIIGYVGCHDINDNHNNAVQEKEVISTQVIADKKVEKSKEEILEEQNQKELKSVLREAQFEYGDTITGIGLYEIDVFLKVIPTTFTIEDKTEQSKIGGTNNYIGYASYEIYPNGSKEHLYYCLKILLENKVDEEGNITPLGYSVLQYSVRKSIWDSMIWSTPVGDNFLDIALRTPKMINKETLKGEYVESANNYEEDNIQPFEMYGEYFSYDIKENVHLMCDISDITKENAQDCINEFYAIKGYEFKEEPYKTKYQAYNGYIEDIDDILLTDREKELIDKLVSIKNQ